MIHVNIYTKYQANETLLWERWRDFAQESKSARLTHMVKQRNLDYLNPNSKHMLISTSRQLLHSDISSRYGQWYVKMCYKQTSNTPTLNWLCFYEHIVLSLLLYKACRQLPCLLLTYDETSWNCSDAWIWRDDDSAGSTFLESERART